MPRDGAAEGPGGGPGGQDWIVLQRVALPDPRIGFDPLLFVRLAGATADEDGRTLLMGTGGQVRTDTYVNLLNLATWVGRCRIDRLALRLRGEGRLRAVLRHRPAGGGAPRPVLSEVLDLSPQGALLPLDGLLEALRGREGLLDATLEALEPVRLTEGAFLAPLPADAAPIRLAAAVTTFRREAAVAETIARLGDFLEGEGRHLIAPGSVVRLFVVDNGRSLALGPREGVTVIPNPNLGGAGGFARGLAAAEDWGATHALFMDDDAAFPAEAFLRTTAFLRLAREPGRAALAGAMVSAARPHAMWENGAVFDRACRPLFVGTDLRDPEEVARMELQAARPKPRGFYGGWWFFAFPLAALRHYPFPFFVRGDDISFSLAHAFDIATLNGVVSFQDDFSAKESPLTLYLDLRNHLHHHLVHEALEIGPWGTARIALRFLGRSICRMHYDSAEAQLAAWEDVMRGPGFFAANADLEAKRAEILRLVRSEAWRPLEPGEDPHPLAPEGPPPVWRSRLAKWSLNGHLLPFWRRIAGAAAVPLDYRGLIWPLWGRSEVLFVDGERGRAYRVRHSKRRAFSVLARAAALTLRWRRRYNTLRAQHRAAYGVLAARPFWEARFTGLPAELAPPLPPGAEPGAGAAPPAPLPAHGAP
ncbi:glycosyltransferase [Rubellimicrobium sp. CFH 75288]|uniref:glycosyltransferase n=1 Tax=Rubellimicrobium sp. CFH 75288 TaxID=2697034 RepID=UPI0014122B7F|nr:glycosyltransferase [Rubellimicrobium sp. CFH 75288]NAZ38186.1 glycosyltransferase [Rubellimicrobium sp. CFH 75288]